jgi:hypothetical protein
LNKRSSQQQALFTGHGQWPQERMSSTDEPNSFHSGGVVGQPELELLNDHFRVARHLYTIGICGFLEHTISVRVARSSRRNSKETARQIIANEFIWFHFSMVLALA